MVDLPLAPFIATPGGSGRYWDTPNIAAYDLAGDWAFESLLAAADWTGAAASIMALGLPAGIEGVAVWRQSDGTINVHHGDGVTTRVVTFTDPAFLDGTTHLLRVEWDNSTPLVSLLIDGTLAQTIAPANSAAGVGSGEDLHIGADVGGTTGIWVGSIYYAQLEDAAGAVIARCDAVQALAAVT